MVAVRKRKRGRETTLAGSAALTCILRDFRILSVNLKRFLRPEEARRGRYKVQGNAQVPDKVPGDQRHFYVSYILSIAGNRLVGEGDKQVVKDATFEIKLESEGLFEIMGPSGKDDHILNDQVGRAATCMLHALAMDRIRGYAVDMGFKGVRPSLGIEPSTVEVSTSDTP